MEGGRLERGRERRSDRCREGGREGGREGVMDRRRAGGIDQWREVGRKEPTFASTVHLAHRAILPVLQKYLISFQFSNSQEMSSCHLNDLSDKG